MENKPRLLTPGPTPLPEEVRLVLAKDMVHHRKTDFVKLMEALQPDLQYLFGTAEQVLPLSCSGTGAMVASVSTLFAPGEKVLVVEGGKFGERWREIAQSRGVEVLSLPLEPGTAVQPQTVRTFLDADPRICGVLVQASETSTGVRHPVQSLGEITCTRDVLLVVDGISAVGIAPCPMDAWHIDCLLTGSQKGLMTPPGLALVSLSSRAWEKADAVNSPEFYFNLRAERAKNFSGQTLFTSSVSLLQGLAVSARFFREQTLEKIYRKQWALTAMARSGIQALGLRLFAETAFTWGLTSVVMPRGVSSAVVLAHAGEKYAVTMAGGQAELKNKLLRIGHMGYVDSGDLLMGLHAVRRGLEFAGRAKTSGVFLEEALCAYECALETGYPTGENYD